MEREEPERKEPGSEASALLRAWSDGGQSALEKLTALVYDELHRLAHYYMQRERSATACKRQRW